MYILTARALAGPDGSGLTIFMETTGASDFIGYIVIAPRCGRTSSMGDRVYCATNRCAVRLNQPHLT
jgi:hypothetical protein